MSAEVGSMVPKQRADVMPPPAARAPKRKREQVVLDEDDWAEKIEAIVQRDYFPDLPKLESELEWLEAVRSKDPVLIRQAQANIVKRRAGLKTPMGHTPATFATPATMGTRTPNVLGVGEEPQAVREIAEQGGAAPAMSLDRFMALHTSEDNASFVEILAGINKRRREKHELSYGGTAQGEVKLLKDSRPLDGFGTSGQEDGALVMRPEDAANPLFYGRDPVPWSESEIAAQAQGPPKEITASNTRLPAAEEQDIDPAAAAAAVRPTRGDGYEPVATPAFTPGPDAPPPMTWGRAQATPARLEDDSAGPRFHVPERKAKDVLAHSLADGARLNLQKRAALLSPSAALGLRQTPRLRSRTLATPGLRAGMSPAAHRLASSLRGKHDASDLELRASYRQTGLRGATPSATPAQRERSETPAILPGRDSPPRGEAEASAEERSVRAAALAAFDSDVARSQALRAFEPKSARQDALKAFGRLTDGLLDM